MRWRADAPFSSLTGTNVLFTGAKVLFRLELDFFFDIRVMRRKHEACIRCLITRHASEDTRLDLLYTHNCNKVKTNFICHAFDETLNQKTHITRRTHTPDTLHVKTKTRRHTLHGHYRKK